MCFSFCRRRALQLIDKLLLRHRCSPNPPLPVLLLKSFMSSLWPQALATYSANLRFNLSFDHVSGLTDSTYSANLRLNLSFDSIVCQSDPVTNSSLFMSLVLSFLASFHLTPNFLINRFCCDSVPNFLIVNYRPVKYKSTYKSSLIWCYNKLYHEISLGVDYRWWYNWYILNYFNFTVKVQLHVIWYNSKIGITTRNLTYNTGTTLYYVPNM